MEYLTLKVSSARGPLYEKDFSASDVFGPFVHDIVTNATKLGHLTEGEHYWAAVIPGDSKDAAPKLFEAVEETAARPDRSEWLTLMPGEGDAGDPLASFTLELHVLPPNPRVYRRAFPISEVRAFTDRIAKTLTAAGITRDGETVSADLFACSGDAPRFDRETVHQKSLLDDVTNFEIKVEALAPDESITEKPVPDCACGFAGDENPDSLLVLFTNGSLERLTAYVRARGSRSKEMGGILIGEVHRVPRSGRLFIEVEGYVPAKQTRADAVSLRFTHETWQQMDAERRAMFPPEKITVGWYHTHPPVPLTVGGKKVTTVRFLSSDDEAVHRQHFSRRWQIALVMDAESPDMGVFQWRGDSLAGSTLHRTKS